MYSLSLDNMVSVIIKRGQPKDVLLETRRRVCGVIVCGYPSSASFRRRLVLPKISMEELNEKLSVISRVVVHPKYRTIGLGCKLIRETLARAGTEYVEMSAVMAKYNPFAEKAGLKKIVEQAPPKAAMKIVEFLRELEFNDQLLSSQKYVLEKLQTLSEQEIMRIRGTFVKHSHPRFMKAFSYHLPYGQKQAYRKEIEQLSLEKLAHLIKVCGFLLQTKVYLFWSREVHAQEIEN